MTVLVAVLPSVASRHLPLKGGDWTAYAAPCGKLVDVLAQLTTGGHGWRGRLPISPLEGEMSATLTEGGEGYGHHNGGGNICVL
jgi:hypothetical protein